MKIHYEGLDLDVDFFQQVEEKADGYISSPGYIMLENVSHKGESITRLLSDEQVEEIEAIIENSLLKGDTE
jgi:hypothetical protein